MDTLKVIVLELKGGTMPVHLFQSEQVLRKNNAKSVARCKVRRYLCISNNIPYLLRLLNLNSHFLYRSALLLCCL